MKTWVKSLATQLRMDGIDVILDQWEASLGDQLSSFMEGSIRDSDFVVVVCTPTYKDKSDQGMGGVGYEGSIMTGELVTGASRRKFIPALRLGTWAKAAPSWLLGSFYVDLTGDPFKLNAYKELLDTVLDQREKAPPVGTPLPDPLPPRVVELPEQGTRQTELETVEPSTWAYAWKQLVDQAPGDRELLNAARPWLHKNTNQKTWPFVWEEFARINYNDSELRELAIQWLLDNRDQPAWAFVWRRLAELNPGSPKITELGLPTKPTSNGEGVIPIVNVQDKNVSNTEERSSAVKLPDRLEARQSDTLGKKGAPQRRFLLTVALGALLLIIIALWSFLPWKTERSPKNRPLGKKSLGQIRKFETIQPLQPLPLKTNSKQ